MCKICLCILKLPETFASKLVTFCILAFVGEIKICNSPPNLPPHQPRPLKKNTKNIAFILSRKPRFDETTWKTPSVIWGPRTWDPPTSWKLHQGMIHSHLRQIRPNIWWPSALVADSDSKGPFFLKRHLYHKRRCDSLCFPRNITSELHRGCGYTVPYYVDHCCCVLVVGGCLLLLLFPLPLNATPRHVSDATTTFSDLGGPRPTGGIYVVQWVYLLVLYLGWCFP